MKSFFDKLKKLFSYGQNDRPSDPFKPDEIAAQITKREQEIAVEPGRRIHESHYRGLDLFLDLDITETYRITVYNGKERVYSFSVYCGQGEYEELKEAYRRIASFLEGNGDPGELPDDDRLKGFYYGG